MILLILNFFLSSAMACLEFPKDIKLDGATFDEHIKLGVKTNCNVTFVFNYDQKTHYFRYDFKDKKLCIDENNQSKCEDEISGALPPIKDGEGKVVGLFEYKKHQLYLFSTTDGKKDIKKPYLKIEAKELKNMTLNAIENSKTIGQLDAQTTLCTRGGNTPGRNDIHLRGKSYSSSEGGCKSGFDQNDYIETSGSSSHGPIKKTD